MTNACIIPDTALPQGRMLGYSASGALIVHIENIPVFRRVIGTSDDEDRVKEWHVHPDHARRIAAVAGWKQMGYRCGGTA